MAELTVADFEPYFSALWGTPEQARPPFRWQRDLAGRVLAQTERPWPEAIALPTAAGKTACLDIAVFALAAQAGRIGTGRALDAPRRIFFVVDRRVIVDEAYERASQLARRLREATGGILKQVADNLRRIARGEAAGFESELPLSVHLLRGGMYRSEAWARDPLQPTIVATTVDQLGSRLLFRAYGRGPGMLPVYAALIANDSLVLLDEAHCAQPFLQSLKAVERYRAWAEQPLPTRFHPVVLSATPPAATDVFKDDSDERRDPAHPLGRRQLAPKPVSLYAVAKARGAKAGAELAQALAARAEELAAGEPRAVVVFVNRVATARRVRDLLDAHSPGKVTLLTGRMRPIDKQEILETRLAPFSSARSEKRALAAPHFVVATQTLEVGADLDFDALVTECASLDALRQRFGRLNRMGRDIAARAAILVRGDQSEHSDDDPVYGAALAETWKWLNRQQAEYGAVDFGIAALEKRLAEENLAPLVAPARNAPVMAPAHLDGWVQTSFPQPVPVFDVSCFLHGEQRGAADVQVCWRADLELEDEEGELHALESLSLCPPSSTESLPVPFGIFRRWMSGASDIDDTPDIEGVMPDIEVPEEGETTRRRVVVWRGSDSRVIDDPMQIRPGDVVVIPLLTATSNGTHQLGDLPALPSRTRLDAGDRAHRIARAKALIRLDTRLVSDWPEGDGKAIAGKLLKAVGDGDELDPGELREDVGALLKSLASDAVRSSGWESLADMAATLRSSRFTIRQVGKRALFIIGQTLLLESSSQAHAFSDEDDSAASGLSRPDGRPVPLVAHLNGAARFARRFGRACGLNPPMVDAIECAARLHDLGKVDPRFQAMLHGGSRWVASAPLAKSAAMPRGLRAWAAARRLAGYPEGARHELLSVRLAESAPALLPGDEASRDLVLHLIAAHHGHCRPFAPAINDDGVVAEWAFDGKRVVWNGPTGMERLGAGVPDRFWRLVRRYGWWGLAWLEALVRLADHRRSEWEEGHHEDE